MIEENMPFPPFKLIDSNGSPVTNENLKSSKTVIYFYPKDDTSGCTKEACEFRDALPSLHGARVIGISPDDSKSHQKFISKYNLNFTLLTDENHQLADALGIWVEKSLYGKKYMGVERTTYLLDENAIVRKIWRKVKPEGHAAEVQALLSSER